jgi:hypothetical protein
VNVSWFKWRPVVEQIASLSEVESQWTLFDLAEAHEALDLKLEAEIFYAEKNQPKK